jgi:hypothetical protein
MNDTSPAMERMITERYRRMSLAERVRIASAMFEAARSIVESSLPPGLTHTERRLAFARRLYAGELPEAALRAYAAGTEDHGAPLQPADPAARR